MSAATVADLARIDRVASFAVRRQLQGIATNTFVETGPGIRARLIAAAVVELTVVDGGACLMIGVKLVPRVA